MEHTAQAVGSGNMSVLATPMMVALMENAAMKAVAPALAKGETTVGTEIAVTHVAATAVGKSIAAKAVLVEVDGRRLCFEVEAYEGEKLLGKGTHQRFVVNQEKFLGKLG